MSGSSSSTAVVLAQNTIVLDSSDSEYSPGFITGDELMPGVPTNISFIVCQKYVDTTPANVYCIFVLSYAGDAAHADVTANPTSEEEEVLFYGPPTLSEHRALVTINRLLTPQMPHVQPTAPPVQPSEPTVQPPELTVDTAPAVAAQDVASEGIAFIHYACS